MIVEFRESSSGAPIYINPTYVISVRPDPGNPGHASEVKLSDGEILRVVGDAEAVASRLQPAPFAAAA